MPGSRKKKKTRWIRKLRNKYRLVILNDETFEEKFSFKLSRMNVFVTVGFSSILLVVITIFVIAFTPLREYIPGYTDVTLSIRVNELLQKTDSLENAARQKMIYVENIRRIIDGSAFDDDSIFYTEAQPAVTYENIQYTRSPEDSLLREEYRRETSYDIYYYDAGDMSTTRSVRSNLIFFTPLKGIVTSEFDLAQKHYGIDIVSRENEAVMATLDGTVIFADWTIETGHTISIQHAGNFISVYKHNSVLLKKQGIFVRAGEPIAIVGASGELTTGLHLHFELWHNGVPVNPRDYIIF